MRNLSVLSNKLLFAKHSSALIKELFFKVLFDDLFLIDRRVVPPLSNIGGIPIIYYDPSG